MHRWRCSRSCCSSHGASGTGFLLILSQVVLSLQLPFAVFPLVWILANRRSVFARRVWPMVSVGLFAIIAVLQFGGYWVP